MNVEDHWILFENKGRTMLYISSADSVVQALHDGVNEASTLIGCPEFSYMTPRSFDELERWLLPHLLYRISANEKSERVGIVVQFFSRSVIVRRQE